MNSATLLIGTGAILLVSLLADAIGNRTGLPRVSLLVLTGVLAGPFGLDVLPAELRGASELVAAAALTMVAFLLGGDLSAKKLAVHGREILVLSAAIVLSTFVFVAGGLALAGLAPPLALLLGAIATATAPAATRDVLHQTGAKGPFAELLTGIVAVDDAWGLIVFGFAAALAAAMLGNGTETVITHVAWDLGGAIGLGVLLGLPAAYLTGRIRPGEPLQSEALGLVLLCGGVALYLEVSFLLAAIVLGTIIANLARHHTRSFREIERIEWPFLALFFVLAGASLDLTAVVAAGAAGALFVGLRIIGRFVGGYAAGTALGLGQQDAFWIGPSLLPQAGVAMGMALVAASTFPEFGEVLLAIAVGGTIIFELAGPVATRIALSRTSAA